MTVLSELGVSVPVLAAPMAGGPTTPELVVAAAACGSLGLLAAGYKSVEALAGQVAEVRARTAVFGVNLFAPNPVPVDAAEFRRYASELQPDADHYGLDLTGAEPVEDDDAWAAKVDLLTADPVPLVSFTFGIPDPTLIRAFRRAGTLTAQTVTSPAEARAAEEAGVDLLAVQGREAGGHYGTLRPRAFPEPGTLVELVRAVRSVVRLPVIAAGGLATPEAVADTVNAGADAVAVGTVLLRSAESGASDVHRAALADPDRDRTVVTHAFTGRPARALANGFVAEHGARAPYGYPALHHLTSGLRKAAAAAGNAELVHLWAGTGYRHATTEPTTTILARLASTL